jgi:hypothetical protein
MANAADTLNRAYELIETGNVGSARNLLDTIRSQQSDNPDFWWVYAHAVEDKVEGIDALDRLRALDPDYPGITMLYREMELALPANAGKAGVAEVADRSTSPEMKVQGQSRRRLVTLVLGIMIIIVVVIAAAFLINRQPGTQTTVIAENTAVPIVTPEATDAPVIAEATAESVQPSIEGIIAQSGIATTGVRMQATTLGNTLVVAVCALPGPATSSAIVTIISTLSSQGFEPSPDIMALAFASTDCTTNTETTLIGAGIDIYRQFGSGSLNTSQFLQNQIRIN